ncbi:hypothetical protein FF38_06846 [Lucilia cuprina]|uniref:Uncharacterized protein n=1 Tax=Lucilia cuprina TaxID=7375 RepID=A0A0L0CMP6_LUCCU|nr:hypothetical protein FF38_06846 [Lucilia cuprina]
MPHINCIESNSRVEGNLLLIIMTKRAFDGVVRRAPVINKAAARRISLKLLRCEYFCTDFHPTSVPNNSMGLTTMSKSHLVFLRFMPHDLPIALLDEYKAAAAFDTLD